MTPSIRPARPSGLGSVSVPRADEIRRRWREAAPRWQRYDALLRELTEPVSRALVDAAGPVPGERWLDVAGGLGDPAAFLAERIAGAGRVVMTDVALEMARAAADTLDGNAHVVTAAAEALPFGSRFDGATCRFGAMFFADPQSALTEIRRALTPGGRAVFALWAAPERNPFFGEVSAAVRDVVPDLPAPEPDDPHAFRYAPPGKFPALLRATGWVDVEERTFPFLIAGRLSPDEYREFLFGMSADLEALLAELPEDRRALLRARLHERVAPYFREGAARFPAEARLVLARAPEDGA